MTGILPSDEKADNAAATPNQTDTAHETHPLAKQSLARKELDEDTEVDMDENVDVIEIGKGQENPDVVDDDIDMAQDKKDDNAETTPEAGAPPAPDFTTEPPEVAQWDVLREPVPQIIVSSIPIEVWAMILSHVPPCRLARMFTISKNWKSMIEQLPLWKEIVINCNLVDISRPVPSYMKLVLGCMVVICDLCLQRSSQLGVDLPLPLRRPDLLALIWMCKKCRRWYGAMHPEVMSDPTRAHMDSDVYEQGPYEKIQPRRSYRRYDRFDDYYSETDSDDSVYCYELRSDSRLCMDFINGTRYNPDKLVVTMREMAWFFEHTEYPVYNQQGSETAKAKALTDWTCSLLEKYGDQTAEAYKTVENAPPESLWPMIEFALAENVKFEEKKGVMLKEVEERRVREKEEEELWKKEREQRRKEREQRALERKQREKEREKQKKEREAAKKTSTTIKKDAEPVGNVDGGEGEEAGRRSGTEKEQVDEARQSIDADDDGAEEDYLDEVSDLDEEYWGDEWTGESDEASYEEDYDEISLEARMARTWMQGALMRKFNFKIDCAVMPNDG
ncbi:hypothetical protein BGZ54_001008 [Gamsiella multidivaricata]|nr:hypothetical protein BGZ54_001008 [Gamsiella multidivaricata]